MCSGSACAFQHFEPPHRRDWPRGVPSTASTSQIWLRRELVKLVAHLQRFPNDPLEQVSPSPQSKASAPGESQPWTWLDPGHCLDPEVAASVFAFDVADPQRRGPLLEADACCRRTRVVGAALPQAELARCGFAAALWDNFNRVCGGPAAPQHSQDLRASLGPGVHGVYGSREQSSGHLPLARSNTICCEKAAAGGDTQGHVRAGNGDA